MLQLKHQRMSIVHGMWRRLIILWRVIAVAATCACLLLVLAEVILRYVLKHPLMGIEELTTMIGMWAFFTGAVIGSYERSHVKAEVVQVFFTENSRGLIIVRAVCAFIALGLACYVSIWGYDYLVWGIQMDVRSGTLFIPMVYSQSAISLGVMIMAFYFLIEFIDYAGSAMRGWKRRGE